MAAEHTIYDDFERFLGYSGLGALMIYRIAS